MIEKPDNQSVLDPVVIRANRPIEENRAAMLETVAMETQIQSEVAVSESSARSQPAFWLIGLWLVGVAVIAAAALLRSVLFLRWLRTFPRRKHDALSDQLDGLAGLRLSMGRWDRRSSGSGNLGSCCLKRS